MKLMPTPKPIVYPDSDGNPMAENTLQFEWIATIKGNLDALFANNPNVFVAGDLLWYPVEGHPEIRQAPDALVAIGRPKGHRGSYMQWLEAGIAPQVVFEVLSPGNRLAELIRKQKFYEQYGVEEYYVYDPDRSELTGWLRQNDELGEIPTMNGWTSPRLGIRFDWDGPLTIRYPSGSPFLTFQELADERDRLAREREQADADRKLAEWEKGKAVAEKVKAIVEKDKAVVEKDKAVAEKEMALAENERLRARLAMLEKP